MDGLSKKEREAALSHFAVGICDSIANCDGQDSSSLAKTTSAPLDVEPIDKDGRAVPLWASVFEHEVSPGFAIWGQLIQQVPQEAVLGTGKYGVVWRARDRISGVTMAVKNTKVDRRNAVSQREGQLAELIQKKPHPCIVAVYSVHHFHNAAIFMILMEFCPNGSLLDRVFQCRIEVASSARTHYEPPCESHRWIGQVFLGLEHLHLNTGVLFRDLKPDNIVLDRHHRAKLTDFGLGRVGTSSKGMSFGFPAGTAGYIAPELLRGEAHDFRADLYSLGVLIWLLLTGGVAYALEPMPPSGVEAMQHAGDYRALFEDWRRLQESVSWTAESGDVLHCGSAMASDALDLTLKLVQRKPRARLDHSGVRAHPFIASLELPGRQQGSDAVMQWLSCNDGD